jgi:tetratricopeptide (TPR) repeat protein
LLGRDLYQAGRDQNFYGVNGPAFVLETPRTTPPPSLADLRMLRRQPSLLLNARHEAIAFTGRTDELAALRAWRERSARHGIWLLHAAGGQGKSRLAARAGEQAAADGWSVVHARHRTETTGGGPRVHLEDFAEQPVLVIVDYAERLPLEELNALMRDLTRHPGRLRVLLLARSVSWWPAISTECGNLAMVTEEPRLLRALATDRRRLFHDASRRFAEIYELAELPAAAAPAGQLSDPAYAVTLGLHMAALAAVDAHATGRQPPGDSADLSRYLLDRERLYWTRLHGDPRTAARCVFIAALAGAQLRADGAALLDRVGLPHVAAATAQQLLDDHARCYPPADPGTVLEPLYPDRLAEDFITLTLPGTAPTGHDDGWSADLIVTARRVDGRTVDRPGDLFHETPAFAGRAFIFLAAAATRSRTTRDHLRRLLAAEPRLVIEAGGAALLAVVPHTDEALARAISSHVPAQHLDLDPAAAVLSEHLVRLTGVTADPDRHATDLTLLAIRLANAGRRDEAPAPAEKAVTIRRRLAAADPAEQLAGLAAPLNNLGSLLSRVGRPEEALACAEEALEIRRWRFFADPMPVDPTAYRADLADSLNNLGNRLSELGRKEEALAPVEEAITIRRRLAEADPATHLPDLAMSVNNLGILLAGIGRWDESLCPAEEATDIYRHLAEVEPAAYLPDLAMSVNNLGASRSQAGRGEEALAATEEAVAIRRRLAEVNPAAHLPDLAMSVNNLGAFLAQVGRREEALTPAYEATRIYRRLAQAHSGVYLPHFAGSLQNLGASLSQVGRRDEALAAAQEAITIRRRLAETGPVAHLPGLAQSLFAYAWGCLDLGDNFAEALEAIDEAIVIYELLTPRLPHLTAGQLAGARRIRSLLST